MVSSVQDLVILEFHGKRFLFVLHSDGTLRVWDLAFNGRVFSSTFSGKSYFCALVQPLYSIHLLHALSPNGPL